MAGRVVARGKWDKGEFQNLTYQELFLPTASWKCRIAKLTLNICGTAQPKQLKQPKQIKQLKQPRQLKQLKQLKQPKQKTKFDSQEPVWRWDFLVKLVKIFNPNNLFGKIRDWFRYSVPKSNKNWIICFIMATKEILFSK